VCIDYARFVDVIRLRIHTVRSALKASAEHIKLVQEFVCVTPACAGARYSTLDAARIINPETGAFHCETCGGALSLDVGEGEAGDDAAAKRKRDEARQLLQRFDAAVKPLEAALQRAQASGAEPPDYGSLQDWVASRAAAARDEAKRKKPGYAGGGRADRRNGTFDFLEDTEFEVRLEGAAGGTAPGGAPGAPGAGAAGGGAAGGAAAARGRKVVPPWMVRQGLAARAAAEEAPAAKAAADAYAAEYVRQYQAYLAAQNAAKAAGEAPAGDAAAAMTAPAPAPAPAPAATDMDADGDEWEDV
jgi:hypothetical protein